MAARTRDGRSIAGLLLVCLACSSQPSPPANPVIPSGPSGSTAVRVLMLTATAGFRHDSIATARQVLTGLGTSSGAFTITATEDLSAVNATTLTNFDVLFFAMTSGELAFTADQKAAILSFVSRGGGFLGTHSATDTLYDWPEYGALVGAYFREHPWTQIGTVIVEDGAHPSTTTLGDRFSIQDEFYTFRENPRPRVHVLLRLDAASVGASGDYPLAWVQSYGSGRVYYNALGHFSSTWNNIDFQRQMVGAIQWAAGR
jgi:type 1 glutamine amidotransferase